MSEPRCECCDLPTNACGKDAEQAQIRELAEHRRRLLSTYGWFPAAHSGKCAECGDPFQPDTPIIRHPDGWRTACCADEETA